MVNRGGEKISPVEVDEAMMLSTSDVKEAASFAVQDSFYGQEIGAAVVVRDGSQLTEEDLQKLLEKRLAKFKIPKRIHFCRDKIPKGPTGKVQRNNLAKLFGEQESGGKGAIAKDDVYGIIDTALDIAPGQSKKSPDATLLELGANSLDLTKLVSSVKRSTGKQLSMAELFSFPTVANVVDKLNQRGASSDADEDVLMSRPKPFSLLSKEGKALDKICQDAHVSIDDLEDAFPWSASQSSFMSAFVGKNSESDLMWMLNRYRVADTVDEGRLVTALQRLQEHEESFRWVLGRSVDDWITLQLKPGIQDRIIQLQCQTEEEVQQLLNRRLSQCRHSAGSATAQIFVVTIGKQTEIAIIESHLYTEGQGRHQILEALQHAYDDENLEDYSSYSAFVQRYTAGPDPSRILEFWRNEQAAMVSGEGSDWAMKEQSLVQPPKLLNERLETLGSEEVVTGPFPKLTVRVGMTLPLVVEAVFALSLSLYLGQQGEQFTRGHVVYNRAVSQRRADPGLGSIRGLTGAYHPNFLLLDTAKSSLWSYLQYFKGVTQVREDNVGMNSTAELACHAAAFTWRFHDSLDASPGRVLVRIKDEAMAMRAFKSCFVNGNRVGRDGVNIAVGLHPKWVDEQENRGSRVSLMAIMSKSLKFFANKADELQTLSLQDVRKVVLEG